MRLGGRLQAAIDILNDIETRRRPVADALKDWGLSHRFAGSGDRAAIGNIVYDALRLKLSHRWLMDSDAAEATAFAVLLRQWGFTFAQLQDELADDRFAPALPSLEAIARFEARRLDEAPFHVQADIPDWLQPSFERAFADCWLAEAQALNARPPLDLRVNLLKVDREKALKALARTGAHETATAPAGMRIDPLTGAGRHPNVTAELAFQKGWFEVQDEGSQLVAELVAPRPGDQVLDLCAGGGGKTLALSAAMENKGQIHAYDADRRRLAPIIERLRRAGTRNVQVHDEAGALGALEGRMDRVLVDAPCTGTGTWRRRPDTKWRLTEKSLAERTGEQDAVLAEARRFVRPGGLLVYVTCSVLPQENDDRIAAFLDANPDFAPHALAAAWQDRLKAPLPSHRPDDTSRFVLTPATTGTDGFFIAALRRGE
jgi:16S rRNA (cytosine967-C5)-methyltransferase